MAGEMRRTRTGNNVLVTPTGGSVGRTLQTRFGELPHVEDWRGHNGDPSDTNAVKSALAALNNPAGARLRMDALYSIEETILFGFPIILDGVEAGTEYQDQQNGRTVFRWAGGVSAAPMAIWGKNGADTKNMAGGKISRLRFDGNGQAAIGLRIKDAQFPEFDHLFVHNVTQAGVHITNTPSVPNPTAYLHFRGLYVDLRANGMNSAHGVLVDGDPSGGGSSGVTLCRFEHLKVNHANGDGVRWVGTGDGFVFIAPHMFRSDAETGYSFNVATTDAVDIVSHLIFLYPIAHGGFYFAKAGENDGTTIIALDGQNIAPGTGDTLIAGPGATEVGGYTAEGQLLGTSSYGSMNETIIDDSMSLVYFDVTNYLLLTNQGAWKLVGAGGLPVGVALDGGGIDLATLAVADDSLLMQHVTTAANGVSRAKRPKMLASIDLVDLADIKARWGGFNSNADPAGAGVWIEYDPTLSSGAYRCITRSGSVSTVTALSFGPATNPQLRWRIECQATVINFYYATVSSPNPQLWTLAASHTTTLPSAILAWGAYVKTTVATIKKLRISHMKLVQDINYR